MPHSPILLIYDKQCPACRYYSRLLRIRESLGDLQLINARENSEIMQEITARGLDIDQGIVVKIDNQFYYGADAVHALALISSRSGLYNRLNYGIFKSKNLSRYLYPLLRAMRNLLLKLLGKNKINNLGIEGNDRF